MKLKPCSAALVWPGKRELMELPPVTCEPLSNVKLSESDWVGAAFWTWTVKAVEPPIITDAAVGRVVMVPTVALRCRVSWVPVFRK